MDGKNVISFTKARSRKIAQFEGDSLNFQDMFTRARELRFKCFAQGQGDILVLDWNGVKDFFQREIAKEVFQQKLFSRSVLMSIWFVSDLLTSFVKGDIPEVGIEKHMRSYSEKGDPNCLLRAANSAFLYFVFWPETRLRRSVQYQKLGSECGPSLYAQYGSVARKPCGFEMAIAFGPIGEIVRKQFK